jgi:hypothetical protein
LFRLFEEAETWFSVDLPKFRDVVRWKPSDNQQRIKVAVLDTGIDRNDVFIEQSLFTDKAKISSFTENNCWSYPDALEPLEDKNGHGTQCAALLLRTAPGIELFVVRIMNNSGNMEKKDEDEDDYECIYEVSLCGDLQCLVPCRRLNGVSRKKSISYRFPGDLMMITNKSKTQSNMPMKTQF